MDIERFLMRCAAVPALSLSDPFTAFVSKAQNFDDAIKELDKQIADRGIEEMLRAYKQLFPQQMSFVLPSNVEQEMTGLLEWLNGAEAKMKTLVEAAFSVDLVYQQHVKQLSTLTTLLTTLDTTEKAFKARPEPTRLDVMENFTQWVESSKQLGPAYNRDLGITFKHELQDIQSFIELLKARAEISRLALKATATAKKWKQPDALTNTDKLAKQKETEVKADELLNAQLEAMTKLILSEQIKKFWYEKTLHYRRALASFAKTHTSVQHQMVQAWETLSEEASVPM